MDHNIEIAHAETRARIADIHRTATALRNRRSFGGTPRPSARALAGGALVRFGTAILGTSHPATPSPAVARQ